MKKSTKKILGIIFVVLIVGIFVINRMKPKDLGYTEEVVKAQDINTFYSFTGNIGTEDHQEIVSTSNMPVKRFFVKEGDKVSKGTPLYELDNSSIDSSISQAEASMEIARINYNNAANSGKDQQEIQISNAYESAQSSFDLANSNYEKMKVLYDSGAISQAELDQAGSNLDSAQLQLNAAKSNYDNLAITVDNNINIALEQLKQAEASYESLKSQAADMTVTADIDGEVSDIYIEENQSITMGTPIIDITNYDIFEVNIRIDEYDLAAVQLGKEVEVTINALDKKISGRVTDISNKALVVNGVSFFPASITLDTNEGIYAGMSAEVFIEKDSVEKATTISMRSLQFDNENKPFVYYRDAENKVVTKPVTVGVNDGNIVQILEGLEPGETILLPPNIMTFGPQAGMANN